MSPTDVRHDEIADPSARINTRLIFLDIDGVMHSVDRVQATCTSTETAYTDDRLFEYLPVLGRILDQCPDISVIISSSWRHTRTLQDLQGFFGKWGHRVIGTTSSAGATVAMPVNRFHECRVTAEHFGAADWIIVDDQPGIVWESEIPTPELASRVIWCDPVLGLATPLVATAIVRRFIDDGGV